MWLEMTLEEQKNERTGLARKFVLICSNESCSFYTSPPHFHKDSVMTLKKRVIASRLIGKGRSGFSKLCEALGLTSPIFEKSFATTANFWEKITSGLKEKSFQNAAEKVKSIEKEFDIATSDTFDVATSFDGSQTSRGWTANKGV